MIDIMLFVLLIFVIVYHFFNSIKILVEQYYSLTRLMKCKGLEIIKRKRYYLVCTIFLFGGLLFYYLKIYYLSCFIFLLMNCLLIVDVGLKNYHFTRRNLLLLFLSLILSISSELYIYYKVSKVFSVISVLVVDNVLLVISYCFLFPIEKMIQMYYIKKANKKVRDNHYIVIGVTGSFGKTTTKNFIYSLLSNHFLISRQNHNYNTLMGLCKYINNEVKNEDEILLVELGVDHINSMKKFSKLFKLDYAFVVSIGEMHLSTFKSIDNIVKEKLSIQGLLKKNGRIFINEDVVKKYGERINYDYDVFSFDEIESNREYFYDIIYSGVLVRTKLISRYQISSLVGAIKLSKMLGLSDGEILFGIRNLIIPLRRCSIDSIKNMTVIDNSYNGNLDGIGDIVNSLDNFTKKKIVITGGLIEMGDKFYSSNFELGKKLSKFDMVVFVGKSENHPLVDAIKGCNNLVCFDDLKKAYDYVFSFEDEVIVLLLAKGSDVYLK